MDSKTLTHETGQARGALKRLERDMGRVRQELRNGARNRIVGGLLLLIGVVALIGYFAEGSLLVALIAGAGFLIGALVLIKSLLKIGGARHKMDRMTDGVTKAQAKLNDLEAQSPVEEPCAAPSPNS
ncbi:MAG: hypothetical protein JXA21_26685 [Anaerolineae bacterium]|nr:hypothetical protein [Anaerolineae bacterium]